MSAVFWDEDDRPPPAERKRRRWQVVALGLVVLLAVGVAVAGLFPETLVGRYHDWQLRQYRKDILSGKLSPEALGAELLRRDDGLYYAVRLSQDPDPQVRAAAIERFVAGTSPAQRREPGDNYGGGLESGAEEGLEAPARRPRPHRPEEGHPRSVRHRCGRAF